MMEDAVKGRLILILGIISGIFLISTVSSCSSAISSKRNTTKEALRRMEFEEKLNKLTQEKTKLDEKLSVLQKDLEAEKASHLVTKKALVQEQLVNQTFKEEFSRITKLKEALEEDLKEALMQQGKSVTAATATKAN